MAFIKRSNGANRCIASEVVAVWAKAQTLSSCDIVDCAGAQGRRAWGFLEWRCLAV